MCCVMPTSAVAILLQLLEPQRTTLAAILQGVEGRA